MKKKDCHTWEIRSFMHGSKFRKATFKFLNRVRQNCHSFPHNYGLNNQNLRFRVLRPDLQGELPDEFRVIYAYPLYLFLLTPFWPKRRVYVIRNDRWRMIPLPWKLGRSFHLRGGGYFLLRRRYLIRIHQNLKIFVIYLKILTVDLMNDLHSN